MARPRFTIAGLLGMVVFLAVGLAALRAATDAWDSGVFGVTLTLLLTSLLLAVHRTERRRAYWIGFALFGWAYLVMSLVPPVEARLPTTKFLARLDSLLGARPWFSALAQFIDQDNPSWARPAARTVASLPQGDISMATSQGVLFLRDATTGSPLAVRGGTAEGFVRIGHSLLALVIALIGGSLSRRLYASGRSGHDGEPISPRPSPRESVDD